VQGVITFRFIDPQLVAQRIDFTVDLTSGKWTETPLEQVHGLLVQMAQQYVIDELVRLELRAILADGVAPLRDRIAAGLRAEATLTEIGLEIVAVRVAGLAPTGEVEKGFSSRPGSRSSRRQTRRPSRAERWRSRRNARSARTSSKTGSSSPDARSSS